MTATRRFRSSEMSSAGTTRRRRARQSTRAAILGLDASRLHGGWLGRGGGWPGPPRQPHAAPREQSLRRSGRLATHATFDPADGGNRRDGSRPFGVVRGSRPMPASSGERATSSCPQRPGQLFCSTRDTSPMHSPSSRRVAARAAPSASSTPKHSRMHRETRAIATRSMARRSPVCVTSSASMAGSVAASRRSGSEPTATCSSRSRQETRLLRLHDLHGIFVGYPFKLVARFDSDLAWLADMWAINWRGARLCAWETYFDTPYYEQLQYVGDTRIQALITLYMSDDDRLVRQAIEHFDLSRIPEGITASRYPSDLGQYIPTFSPIWVAMVHDYWMHRDEPEYVRGFLPGIRAVLGWFERRIDETGMLGPIPWWPFVDWARGWERGVPPGGDRGALDRDLAAVRLRARTRCRSRETARRARHWPTTTACSLRRCATPCAPVPGMRAGGCSGTDLGETRTASRRT